MTESYALACDVCGETATYRSCQQPDTEAIAELALAAHKMMAHRDGGHLAVDLVGRAAAQILNLRDGPIND